MYWHLNMHKHPNQPSMKKKARAQTPQAVTMSNTTWETKRVAIEYLRYRPVLWLNVAIAILFVKLYVNTVLKREKDKDSGESHPGQYLHQKIQTKIWDFLIHCVEKTKLEFPKIFGRIQDPIFRQILNILE